ncbi:MAG: hypothetical protein DRP35_11430 [Candidatus Zixiibacteriota bacterium]|nr:MAG: hypothetical protein DRP35_11430 [candidate division Zixibacteria bacterium]
MEKIKSITGNTAFIDENGKPENNYKSSYQEFDSQQNIIKEMYYTIDGEIETANGYKFNESNLLIEETHYLDETEIADQLNYFYNDDGKLNKIETNYSDGSKSIKTINRTELKISATILDEENNFEGEEIQVFDQQGNVIEETIYDEEKKISQKFLHSYNSENQIISTTEHGEGGEFIIKKTFEYNKKGQITKESHYNRHEKLLKRITFEYDNEGELIMQQIGNSYLIKTTFDDKKRRVKDETIDLSNNVIADLKEYKYDENNFMIEEISYKMGQQYELEPGVFGRGRSNYISTKFTYEFYD